MAAAAITLSAAVAIPAGAHFLAEDGSAAGTAATGTLVPVVLEALTGGAGETPNNALQPGSSAEVVLKLNNPNPYPVSLRSVTSSGPIGVTGAPDCSVANAGVSFNNQNGLSVQLNPGIQVVRLANAASMSILSNNSCQGASFALPVTITVETSS